MAKTYENVPGGPHTPEGFRRRAIKPAEVDRSGKLPTVLPAILPAMLLGWELLLCVTGTATTTAATTL